MSRRPGVSGTHSSQPGAQQQQPGSAAPAAAAAIPAYLSKWYEVIGKIGEGTYGVVYLARSRGARSRLLAVKTFKPGKVRLMYNIDVRHETQSFLQACTLRRGQTQTDALQKVEWAPTCIVDRIARPIMWSIICDDVPPLDAQEEDGVSPTAVREIMLLQETQHENIVRLDSVHINREVQHHCAAKARLAANSWRNVPVQTSA